MAIHTTISIAVKKQLAHIQKLHDKRLAESASRAKRDLKKARTRHDKEVAILRFRQEKAGLQQELSEAKIATQKAKAAAEKARKEAGDLTISERFGIFGTRFAKDLGTTYKSLTKSAKRSPPRKRKRVVVSKTVRRR